MIELTGYRDKHEYTNKHGVKSCKYQQKEREATEKAQKAHEAAEVSELSGEE